MPLVTAYNLRTADPLTAIEKAIRQALTSMPELRINDHEVDLVPVLAPDSFKDATTRINVDLWEREERTKDALQELAGRVAEAFQAVTDTKRKVKVVIRPYDIGRSGWVSR
jgi:phenylpyruvate tautomerase PptA (4-oxalocrotonate tautomerase family)